MENICEWKWGGIQDRLEESLDQSACLIRVRGWKEGGSCGCILDSSAVVPQVQEDHWAESVYQRDAHFKGMGLPYYSCGTWGRWLRAAHGKVASAQMQQRTSEHSRWLSPHIHHIKWLTRALTKSFRRFKLTLTTTTNLRQRNNTSLIKGRYGNKNSNPLISTCQAPSTLCLNC